MSSVVTRPVSPAGPQRLTDRKREAIVRAAVEEFRSAGYAATSMDRIASVAKVSKRTVYNHFPSKADLFALMLERLWHDSAAAVDLAYRREVPLAVQLRQLLLQKMSLLGDANFMDLARVAMAEFIHSPARAEHIVDRLGDKESGITSWIRAAVEDGRLREVDPDFASQQVQGLLKTFGFWPQVILGQAPLAGAECERVVDSAVQMFLGCYAQAK